MPIVAFTDTSPKSVTTTRSSKEDELANNRKVTLAVSHTHKITFDLSTLISHLRYVDHTIS